MIAVSAASGVFGRRVVDHLLTRCPAGEVTAVVRAPDRAAGLAARGVRIRHGDYDAPATLAEAFRGVDRLLLISSPELVLERRVRHHTNAIGAAREAGVSAIAYTSFLGADTESEGLTAAHHATERAVRASGIPHVLLRHPFYSEAFLNPGLKAAVDAGELTDGSGGRGLNTASRDDLAEAAARVLTEGHHVGRAYDFTGEPWSFPELARTLSRVVGTPVALRERQAQLPGAEGWLENQVRSGALERYTDDLRRVLGRPATSLDDAVEALFATPSA
ncbi:NAD(P)H-binding protein [Streptomyces sp. FR-108]|uniref:NAD(P)H-binding protein n=1 Tax=Streptomyces sp. FR-108 TaxID=3416665 RepID=UPI003CF3C259